MPDFLNADNADVSDSPYWHPGDPNSINQSYKAGLDTVLDDVATRGAKDALMMGDMVEGHWGRDDAGTGIFGPTDTTANQVAALNLAADEYYSAFGPRFTSRGLTLYPGVGDHELGDNSWHTDRDAYQKFKHDHMYAFKNAWSRWWTADGTRFADHPVGTHYDKTAYATRLSPQVLLVTLDEFKRTPTNIVSQLGDGELAWLKGVLAKAQRDGIPFVMVQGHDPILGPVRYQHSSHMSYTGGRSSALWKVLTQYHVDLYLCGEVHDTTGIVPSSGPVQVSHGGLFYTGQFSYMVGHVDGDKMTLTTRAFHATTSDAAGYLWQTQRYQLEPAIVDYQPGSYVTGTLTLTKDGTVTNRTGMLTPYTP
jgi:hypothetical protein